MKALIILVLSLAFTNVLCEDQNLVKVNTTSGLVVGVVNKILGKSVNTFLGIPYAIPPTGDLRFSKPKPLEKPIPGVINATETGHSCIQSKDFTDKYQKYFNLKQSEDCLVLNIWSTNQTNNNTNGLKPVMFWIYGGGFTIGSIFQLPMYNGSVLATKDVVLVSVNYRIGPFGFLYGGEESAPGNAGFFDQVLALKWVRDNIHHFGGDKNQITVFGESAGSMSTGALILSPTAKNLFHKAILESGAPFHNYLNTSVALSAAKNTGNIFGCSGDNWLSCLRKVNATKLNDNHTIPTMYLYGTEFLPEKSAIKAFEANNFNKDIDIIAGVTRDEGSLLAALVYPGLMGNVTKADVTENMKRIAFSGVNTDIVTKFYLSNVSQTDQNALKRAFSDFYGDQAITCPTHFFANEYARRTSRNVWFYEWTYKMLATSNGDLTPFACGPEWMGICHGSDLAFVFGGLLTSNNNSQTDEKFSELIVNLWTNFAKSGNPTKGSSVDVWPTLKKSNPTSIVSNVMELNPNNYPHILKEPFRATCDGIWKQFMYHY